MAALLGQTTFFGQLAPADLLTCAEQFREQRFEQGQMLFARGDVGDRLLIVAKGRIRLAVMAEDGRELSVRHAVRGELLGEIALLDGGARSADAVALTPCVVHGLLRAPFDRLLMRFPSIAPGVIGLLCQRLRQTTEQLEGIALHSIEVRLARFLLVQLAGRKAEPGKRVPLDITFSQSELAQLIGASRPKVNAALGALETMGALRRTSDRLFCDPEILADFAGVPHG
ncbi:Crp/Fnr family transcriptional regulator [Bosea sp. AAP35]|uniref:Crp/Fnr family transcriptional regulator n=1 Tax=Bosea sp. AAP35 TaxID=1523417 RepID=UPI0020C105A9|nr:Crp/Fnr family transcriptional regulator [Bosea sp. AAP35]